MTIGALIAIGAIVGVDEAALEVLREVAQVVALVYISACIVCLASVPLVDLMVLFCSGEPSVAKCSFKANSELPTQKSFQFRGITLHHLQMVTWSTESPRSARSCKYQPNGQ
jgi:hypothetical protein